MKLKVKQDFNGDHWHNFYNIPNTSSWTPPKPEYSSFIIFLTVLLLEMCFILKWNSTLCFPSQYLTHFYKYRYIYINFIYFFSYTQVLISTGIQMYPKQVGQRTLPSSFPIRSLQSCILRFIVAPAAVKTTSAVHWVFIAKPRFQDLSCVLLIR